MKKSDNEGDLTPTQKKFFNSIIFSKLKRQEFKKDMLRTQKYVLENDDFTKKPNTEEEYEERVKNVWRLDYSIGLLSVIKDMQTADKYLQMIIGHFKLYKKGRAYIIANTYQTSYNKKKINKTFHFMPDGLPIKTRKKEYKYRNKFEFSDYELIDEGNFRQVFDELRGSKISYKGKIYNFRIKYHEIESDKKAHKKTYRIKMLRFEKK